MLLEEAHRPGHVQNRNAFGDRDDDGDTGVGRLHDGVRSGRRRHENHRGVRSGLLHRFGHGVEKRKAFLHRAALAGYDTADHLGAVVTALDGVERAGFAKTLAEDTGVLVNDDTHCRSSCSIRFACSKAAQAFLHGTEVIRQHRPASIAPIA